MNVTKKTDRKKNMVVVDVYDDKENWLFSIHISEDGCGHGVHIYPLRTQFDITSVANYLSENECHLWRKDKK